ncbi:MAG: WD40 repeat domain-containing protein [Treponema sp.]|nr:WD40 repeat domain-containing protein [Treponema sp.]
MQIRRAIISALFCCIAALTPPSPSLYAGDWVYTGIVSGGHNGSINALVHRGDTVLSAGDDGFLEIWAAGQSGDQVKSRFQISPYRIVAMAGRPEKDEVCVIESDGLGLYRVSAWNYAERRNIFTQPARDSLSYINYSTAGNFIIAARTGRSGLFFFNADTGNVMPAPQSLTAAVSLAVTGRSERTMLTYSESGELSYWDLTSGDKTSHFDAPRNLRSPILFGNSRYFAGVNAEGLAVINAVTGIVMASDASVPDGSLLCPSGDEFLCLIQKENTAAQVYRYTIDRAGQLAAPGRFSLSAPGANNRFTSIAAGVAGNASASGSIALGTAAGSLVFSNMSGRLTNPSTGEKINITEVEVSGQVIAFLAGNGTMGFIPLQYNQLTPGRMIRIEQNAEAYNRLTAFAERQNPDGQFVLWQDGNIRTLPVMWRSSPRSEKLPLSDISFRSPVRAVDSTGGKILFLDSAGNITVISPFAPDKKPSFSFSSVGLMDAALVDGSRIIIGRSAVSGNTPFMMINVDTGETVPMPYPSRAGVTLHRGASGSVYAAAVSPMASSRTSSGETDETRTAILHLNLANIADSVKIVDFPGEDTQFSLAESPGGSSGSLAATIGGEGAALYTSGYIQQLDRTSGLPLKLIDGGSFLISLDRDGSLCWHDSHDGKILAIFRLQSGGWTLQTERRTINGRFQS